MSTVDPAIQTVSASIAHLSVYGMLGPSALIDASIFKPDGALDASQGGSDGATGSDSAPDQSVATEDAPSGSDGSSVDGAVAEASSCLTQSCIGDDGCCPPGCDANSDNDCAPVCGNDVIEPGETCDSNCSCQPTVCTTETGTPENCDVACNVPVLSCKTNDGCCPYACNQTNDGDCAGTTWSVVTVSQVDYSNANFNYCSTLQIYGIAPSSSYAVTTCNPVGQNPGTGDPVITSIVDNLGNVYFTGSDDNCTDPSAIPNQAGWSCNNAAGLPTMACSTQATGGFKTRSTANIGRLDVTICASGGPAGAGVAPLYIFYNSPVAPHLG
jgi:hypothetical protein